MQAYTPINCNFYDILESLSVGGKPVSVQFREGEEVVTAGGVITNLFTKEHVEYMQLGKEKSIRLDRIISVNGATLPSSSKD